ncbi:29903_t:CDS:2 [Gigaspora margarita]|uniref:29903_t:CDS:1 n=1 Tax=Gigaspora margarita TaxID=4874 RepID=A0ABN7WS47_GIGMA|nr:29903_t:CDS:2 [Gigaspora margarita]
MRRFEANLSPFDLSYIPNIDTPKIWLEGIAKIRSYHITNIRREISCLDKELTKTDL